MHELEKKYCITYDSWQRYYKVHTQDGDVRFYKDENGLPYIDLENLEEDAVALLVQTGSEEAATALVQAVRQNYNRYTQKEVQEAKEARLAMGLIGNPSKNNLKGMVRNTMIPNCPVTTTVITFTRTILGPDLASVRGKIVQWAPAPVVARLCGSAKGVIKRNKTVTLAAYVLFLDGVAFLLTVSRNIKLLTAEHVAICTAKR